MGRRQRQASAVVLLQSEGRREAIANISIPHKNDDDDPSFVHIGLTYLAPA
jgi:hypothetical protein